MENILLVKYGKRNVRRYKSRFMGMRMERFLLDVEWGKALSLLSYLNWFSEDEENVESRK